MNAATCSRTASTTRGALLPTVVTAMPEPRSISELPSTSTTTPPPARRGEDRHRRPDARGDGGRLALHQLAGPRSGDIGHQQAVLLDGRRSKDGRSHAVSFAFDASMLSNTCFSLT